MSKYEAHLFDIAAAVLLFLYEKFSKRNKVEKQVYKDFYKGVLIKLKKEL